MGVDRGVARYGVAAPIIYIAAECRINNCNRWLILVCFCKISETYLHCFHVATLISAIKIGQWLHLSLLRRCRTQKLICIGAYDDCMSIVRLLQNIFAAPISNITPHQYQILRHTNIKYYAAPLSKLCLRDWIIYKYIV